jgi:hypothetical protein
VAFIVLGSYTVDAANIASWTVFNKATFIRLRVRSVTPHKIPGDYSALLKAANVRAGQHWQRKRRASMSEAESVVEILVRVANPDALDATLTALPGCIARVVGIGTPDGPQRRDGCYVVRVLRGAKFAEFAIRSQGYAEIVSVEPLPR